MKPSQSTWGGRFQRSPAEEARAFTQSVSFDKRLAPHDIEGSIAHAKMLRRVGVLTSRQMGKIVAGLKRILVAIKTGKFTWDPALEDVHMNIEAALIKRVPAGAKLHTARSRNDQVALDMRLYVRDEVRNLQAAIRKLQKALVAMAKKNADVVMPGYTHLQRAQPVLFAHHLLAYVEMFQRDHERLDDCFKRVNVCPLGSGALAGSTIRVDRAYVAKLLGFDGITQNSMDAVSDRDFIIEYCAAASLIAMHLSRLAEDVILWASAEFGFVTVGDAYSTGSSLMPQKKNPDIAELARGKSGRVFGNLVSLLTLLKGLPLTYNRDLQEDKERLFDTVDTVQMMLSIMAAMLANTKVNRQKCEAAASDPSLLATDLADYLVKKGVPFRQAHHAVGKLVGMMESAGKQLNQATLAELKSAHPGFERNALEVFDLERAFDARAKITGAPSREGVRAQLARWERILR